MLTVILFTSGTFAQKGSKPESKKKKLYISTIKANGVNAKLANRVKEGIRLAIFEGFGAQYQVIDDEAVKVMFKQAEAIMASGCDDTSCITQIADGINADEIVYGDVSRDGAKIALSITSLERKGTSLGTKSIVRVSFLESQVDWIASETAKKLMNPGYRIDLSKAPEKLEEVKLGGIELKAIKGLDIAVIQFKSEDETVSKIIDYSKGLVAEGDQYYNKGNYPKARSKYGEVVEKVQTKLSKNKQSQIKEYVNGIHKRISSTLVMEYKPEIEKIDAELNGMKDPGENDLEKALKKYIAVEEKIINIPYVESEVQILTATRDRKDGIINAIISIQEKKGDVYYRDYKFTEALNYYNKGKEITEKIINSAKKAEVVGRLDKKIKATMKTGEGYLVNRVKSLVDQAEFYNFQDKTSNAKSTMKEARQLISGDMKVFVTREAVGYYNGMAEVVKVEPLTPDTLPEYFAEIDRLATIKKQKAAEEKFKKTGVYSIGDTGPAGGIIFYDKGKFSDGWRYLEAAPMDQGDGVKWGCASEMKDGFSQLNQAPDTALGTGKKTTIAIINTCAESGIAAQLCVNYQGGGKNDWYLPSKDELCVMYTTLHTNGIGGFSTSSGWAGWGNGYWSSSEVGNERGWYVNFKSGTKNIVYKNATFHVRAIRCF
jgi:tetratricopeptide (TPR) repeat protein